MDVLVSISATRRCNDGSDETIVSQRAAEQAVIKGTGKISRIGLLNVQLALYDGETQKSSSF